MLHVLHPGEVACGERGDRFRTLLGSCVAIVLTDPRRSVGAMCHIVHASDGGGPGGRDAAWGHVALDAMYRLLRARGIQPRMCDAYLYGGGNMFPCVVGGNHVGAANAHWVLRALQADGLNLLHEDLGGTVYRRLNWTVGPQPPTVEAVQAAPLVNRNGVNR